MARRGDGRSSRPSGQGSTPFDDIIRVISDIVIEEQARSAPRLATVTDASKRHGRRVRIQPWGEASASSEPRPRSGGKKIRNGDLMMLFPTGDGNEVAVGPIVGLEGRHNDRDDTIGGDEIEADAIDRRHIKQNAINSGHISNHAIRDREVGRRFVQRDMWTSGLDRDTPTMSHIKDLIERVSRAQAKADRADSRHDNQQIPRLNRHRDRLRRLDGRDDD